MKTIFFFLLLIPAICKAQLVDTAARKTMYVVGDDMVKFSRTMGAGYCLQIAGGAMILVGAIDASKTGKTSQLTNAGVGVAAFGVILVISSLTHISRAGIHLKENGIAVDIPRKKK